MCMYMNVQEEGTDERTVACQSLLLRALRTFHGVERGYLESGENSLVVSRMISSIIYDNYVLGSITSDY